MTTAQCPYTMGRPFPPQNCPFHGRIWSPFNTWFLGPTRVLNPNGIAIGAAIFAGITSVTDRQTDGPRYRSVTTGHIYIRSTATRPKRELGGLSEWEKAEVKCIIPLVGIRKGVQQKLSINDPLWLTYLPGKWLIVPSCLLLLSRMVEICHPASAILGRHFRHVDKGDSHY